MLVAAGALVSMAACGSGVTAADAFRVGPNKTCLVHQAHGPTKEYRGGPSTDTGLELQFLGYYTAQGTQPFCDGKGPNRDDRAWGALYLQLTSNGSKVSSLR